MSNKQQTPDEKELAEVRKTMARIICGSEVCLFPDGSYPCPVGEDINGSNMCDYCKADYILTHIFTIEGGVCQYCSTFARKGQVTSCVPHMGVDWHPCPKCKGTGKLPDKTFTLAELIKEKFNAKDI